MNEDSKNFHLNKMIKFLDHDAEEIKQNIERLTEENYQMEKRKLILSGTIEIDQLYMKKMKLISRKSAKLISTQMNRAKLEILLTRDKHVKSILTDVKNELIKLRHNKKYYNQILKKLILQAMYQILEKEVDLILVSDDVKRVELMIDELKKTYFIDTGINIKINIEKRLTLPIEEIGGVIIRAKNKTLIVQNTLIVRMLHLGHQVIPFILCGLFGPNPARSHSFTT